MTFLIESLIACAVFTLFVFLMSRNPIKSIFNYPPAIIDRCDKLGLVDASNKPGATEDMTDAYHDYGFHIKGALIGMALGIPAALAAGILFVFPNIPPSV